jgi:hypothetical protein
MSAVAIPSDVKLQVRPAVAGLTRRDAEPAVRSSTSAGMRASSGEYTCPSDCDRDHPNE